MKFVLSAATVVTIITDAFVMNRISNNLIYSTTGMDRQTTRKFASWSEHADFDQDGAIRTVQSQQVDGYNLVSPREWLEYNEGKGGCGAYTVVRCDLCSNTSSWRIWERDYHWKRLTYSYRSLVEDGEADCDDAIHRTDAVLSTLLGTCGTILLADGATFHKDSCCTCMITLLWQANQGRCIVRGHVFSTGVFSNHYNPTPIVASLAIVSTPNRYENKPRSKLSSWCSIRRPLEEQFKGADDSEVLLTREAAFGTCEILEGLTSNVFVLYRNETLRTPAEGVLEGCARTLVLHHAQSMGYSVDCSPVTLDGVGEWDEVFCTSAIRIIIPVMKIVDGKNGRTVWQGSAEPQKWRKFYDSIVADSS